MSQVVAQMCFGEFTKIRWNNKKFVSARQYCIGVPCVWLNDLGADGYGE